MRNGCDGCSLRVKTVFGIVIERKKAMTDVWLILAVVAIWIVLNLWVLPKFGVST